MYGKNSYKQEDNNEEETGNLMYRSSNECIHVRWMWKFCNNRQHENRGYNKRQ